MRRVLRWIALAAVVMVPTLACSSGTDRSLEQGQLVGNWSAASPPANTFGGYWWTFGADGGFGNYDGCNWSGGSYSVENGRVVFGEAASTARACSSPTGGPAGIGPADPFEVRVVEGGRALLIDTTIGEVRLERVAEVPVTDQ